MSQRDNNKIRKHIEVDRSDFEWYIKTHEMDSSTDKTGFSLTMRMLLSAYRQVCENGNGKVDKRSLTLSAAQHVKDEEEG